MAEGARRAEAALRRTSMFLFFSRTVGMIGLRAAVAWARDKEGSRMMRTLKDAVNGCQKTEKKKNIFWLWSISANFFH